MFRDPDKHINGIFEVSDAAGACDSCHGSGGNSAPPLDLAGNSDRSFPGVGAHRQHLGTSLWRKEVKCESCHTVPAALDSPGHLDGDNLAEVLFAGVDAGATYDQGARTCANLYCHGDGTGNNGSASWTSTVPMDCTSCHGAPPPAPHPDSADCAACHPNMNSGPAMTFSEPALHINGVVDVVSPGCDSCHGSGGISAPPVDLDGNTGRNNVGVGAHREHLGSSTWRKEIACATCHTVPGAVGDAGHLDGDNAAEVSFDPFSQSTLYSATGTCSNNYCHGDGRGNNGSASWTSTMAMNCSSCHQYPPPAPHAQSTDCGACHQNVIPGTDTFSQPETHIDGNVDVNLDAACDSCHGSGGQSAPPVDLANNTSRSSPGVGAHRQHLGSSPWRRSMVCSNCHIVPATVTSSGHLDGDDIAEVPFDDFNSLATFTRANNTCSNLYCHGDGTGNNGSISWLSTTAMACDSCHSYPPPAPHPISTACSNCHINVASDNPSFNDPSSHIDGKLDVAADGACDSCHGSNGDPAPPDNLLGIGTRTARGVGAHQEHLTATTMSATIKCERCHTVPSEVGSAGHIDGDNIAEVPFDSLNPSGTVDVGTGTCQNLWCHGNGRGDNGSIVWTGTTNMNCNSCHLSPSPGVEVSGMSGRHRNHIADERMRCSDCHQQVVNSSNLIIDRGLHINRKKDVQMPVGTYAPSTRTCSGLPNGCHGSKRW